MGRARMIRPEIGESQTFLGLSLSGRLLWINMISLTDDAGILPASYMLLTSNILQGARITQEEIKKTLKYLEERKSIFRYSVNGSEYIILLNFFKYQTLNNPTPTKKPLPKLLEDYDNCMIELREWYDNYKIKVLNDYDLKEKKLKEKKLKEKKQGVCEDYHNRKEEKEKIEELKSIVNEYDLDWVESIGKKIFSLDLGENDLRDAFCITQEKKKSLGYALGILERKKKEAEAIEAEEEKRQKYYEAEAEGRKAMMQEWEKNSLSPEENMARLQEMVSGLSQKMVMPAETDAPVSL